MEIQKVVKAYDLKTAIAALDEHKENAQVLAGGTDLLVQIREGHNKCPVLVDVTDVAEMKEIIVEDHQVRIGAAVTFSQVVKHDFMKTNLLGLWEACRSVGAPQIRNLGTLGGNVANGSPAADSSPPLLALEATLVIQSSAGQKVMELKDFFLGKGKTALQPGELISEIILPKSGLKKTQIAFEKLGLRNALAISRISVAVCVEVDDQNTITHAAVASGSLGLFPNREPQVEAALVGKSLNMDLVDQAAQAFSAVTTQRLQGRSSQAFKEEAIKGVMTGCLLKLMNEGGQA